MKLRQFIVFTVFLLMLAAAPVWANTGENIPAKVQTVANLIEDGTAWTP